MKSKISTVMILLAAASSAACFQRVPLDSDAPSPATRVVAELTDSGTVAMGNALGPGALEVEGVILDATPERWTMQMLRVDHRDGRTIEWNREPVTFPRNVLNDAFAVRLDKKKSWLVAGGVVAGAFLVARGFNLIGADESDEGKGPPEPKALVPLLRFGD